MRPSVESTTRSPYGTGEQTHPIGFQCILLPSGAVVPNCRITIEWQAQAGSGGHEHVEARPPGRVDTENGVSGGSVGPGGTNDTAPTISDSSGADGLLGITYAAPESAGVASFNAVGRALIDGQILTFGFPAFTIRAGLDGMVQMPPNSDRFGTGVVSEGHGANDGYVLPSTRAALEAAWDAFNARVQARSEAPVTTPQLFITSAGLPRGGLFDLSGIWEPGDADDGHVGHRFGLDVDVAPMENMSDNQTLAIAKTLKQYAFAFPVDDEAPRSESPDHWHARFTE